MAKRLVWYAAGGGIAKMGPFRSQVDAWEALKLAPVTAQERKAAVMHGQPEPVRGIHLPKSRVWPEVRHG